MIQPSFVRVGFVLLLFSLQGCLIPLPFITYNPFGERPWEGPLVAKKEIEKYGITLTSGIGRFPRDVIVNTKPSEPPFVSVRWQETPEVSVPLLQWYFTPHPDYNRLKGFASPRIEARDNGYSFSFSFVIEDSESSILIPGLNELPADNEVGYLGTATPVGGPKQMITTGNFVLQQRFVQIPLTATHVEVFMQTRDSPEKVSISKVALNNLTAWRKYIKPLVKNMHKK